MPVKAHRLYGRRVRFFPADPDDLKSLNALSQAQDARIKACHKGNECEDAYYVRGLAALFDFHLRNLTDRSKQALP